MSWLIAKLLSGLSIVATVKKKVGQLADHGKLATATTGQVLAKMIHLKMIEQDFDFWKQQVKRRIEAKTVMSEEEARQVAVKATRAANEARLVDLEIAKKHNENLKERLALASTEEERASIKTADAIRRQEEVVDATTRLVEKVQALNEKAGSIHIDVHQLLIATSKGAYGADIVQRVFSEKPVIERVDEIVDEAEVANADTSPKSLPPPSDGGSGVGTGIA